MVHFYLFNYLGRVGSKSYNRREVVEYLHSPFFNEKHLYFLPVNQCSQKGYIVYGSEHPIPRINSYEKYVKYVPEFKARKECRMVKVTDDWYPCFDDSSVKLSIMTQSFGDMYYCKIMAWGADDTGVEIEYTSQELAMVNGIYDHWKRYIYDKVPNGVNRTWFFEHGFYRA